MLAHHKKLQRVQSLAFWLDRKYRIPGTSFHVGMDGLIGLIPGIGDTLTMVMAAWIIYQAHTIGAPFWLKLRMAGNVFVDWLIGLIPLLGDIFDIGFQANQKNADLLVRHMELTA